MNELGKKHCEPCHGGVAKLTDVVARSHLQQVHADWTLDESNDSITREFTVKGYAKAVYLANLVAYLADHEGHHPDVTFGWGYCRVSFTTHDVDGLSENDFICAARLDAMVAG